MMIQAEKRPYMMEVVKRCAYLPLTTEKLLTYACRIEKIAKEREISMAQVSLAWSLSKDFMSAPIVGTTSLDKLKDCVGERLHST